MTSSRPTNSFSWGDALFLYIERPGQPLSMACVCIFEGKVALKACRDLVQSKLPMLPRYRQHVSFPPFNIGLPSWQFDPRFDIRNHIRQVVLKHGTEDDLKALASSVVSTHLDRQKPLWDITLVQGLEGNRTGMIARIHHCLADGIAGVGIMNALMDVSPVKQPVQHKRLTYNVPPARDAGAALLDGLVKSYFSALKGALTLHSEALHLAHGMLANSGEALAELMTIMPELAAPADRLPFNVVCHGPQKFGWTEIPMEEVKAIRQQCGGTVNDVVLMVVAAALRRYSELRGVKVKGRSVRILIPVSVRGEEEVSQLGNRISFLPVTIPLDIRDPQKLFAFVQQRTDYLKGVRAAELVGFAGGLFSAIPTPIWAAIGPVASQLPLSLCNMICTNVPGPQVPLYLLGHQMLAWYPYVPIGGEMGVNCAILSYNGKAYFGFTCDVGAVPDPENLEKFVDASFAELSRSAAAARGYETQVAHEPARSRRRQASRKIPLGRIGKKEAKARGKAQNSKKPPEVKKPDAKKPVASADSSSSEPILSPAALEAVTDNTDSRDPASERVLQAVGD